MKNLLMLAIAVIALISVTTVLPQDQDASEAEQIMLRYFDALSFGDTQTLKGLMGGSLLEKRSRLLNNPVYPQYLAETFGSTIFTIDRIDVDGSGIVGIDVTMKFGKGDIIQRRYLLHRDASSSGVNNTYLVNDEIEPP